MQHTHTHTHTHLFIDFLVVRLGMQRCNLPACRAKSLVIITTLLPQHWHAIEIPHQIINKLRVNLSIKSVIVSRSKYFLRSSSSTSSRWVGKAGVAHGPWDGSCREATTSGKMAMGQRVRQKMIGNAAISPRLHFSHARMGSSTKADPMYEETLSPIHFRPPHRLACGWQTSIMRKTYHNSPAVML
jgi:hypothetical protein